MIWFKLKYQIKRYVLCFSFLTISRYYAWSDADVEKKMYVHVESITFVKIAASCV